MSIRKQRVAATIGRAPVQPPTRRAKNQYLRALAKTIAAYEAEFGTICEAEMTAQQRADHHTAIRIGRARR